MGKLPFIKFYPSDWLSDPVASCSIAAQGLWLRMMILMHNSERYGYTQQKKSAIPSEIIAARCGLDLRQYETLLCELDRAGIPSRTSSGIIFSRRMARDAVLRSQGLKYGALGGNPKLKKGLSGGLTPPVIPSLTSEYEYESLGKGDRGKGPPEPPKPEFQKQIPPALNSPDFVSAWGEFEQHRREIGKKLTKTSAERMLKTLEKMGPERATVAIHHSVAQGWQGVFEPKESAPRSNGKANGSTGNTPWQDEHLAMLERCVDDVFPPEKK